MTRLYVETPDRDERLPVYHRYEWEPGPQPAYVEIDIEAERVTYGYGGGIPGIPNEAANDDRIDRVPLSPYVSGRGLADYLENPDTITLIERIINGYTTDWDGSNVVGSLDDDATEALAELRQMARGIPLTRCPTIDR